MLGYCRLARWLVLGEFSVEKTLSLKYIWFELFQKELRNAQRNGILIIIFTYLRRTKPLTVLFEFSLFTFAWNDVIHNSQFIIRKYTLLACKLGWTQGPLEVIVS